MNATDQAQTPELASKIASLVTLFREEFPDAYPDLSPWLLDDMTQSLLDPHSIDVSFQFPGWHPTCRGHCVLMQVRYADQPQSPDATVLGIEAMGYSYETRQWHLSTIGDWCFEGSTPPTLAAQEKIKRFCRGVFQLLHHPLYSRQAS